MKENKQEQNDDDKLSEKQKRTKKAPPTNNNGNDGDTALNAPVVAVGGGGGGGGRGERGLFPSPKAATSSPTTKSSTIADAKARLRISPKRSRSPKTSNSSVGTASGDDNDDGNNNNNDNDSGHRRRSPLRYQEPRDSKEKSKPPPPRPLQQQQQQQDTDNKYDRKMRDEKVRCRATATSHRATVRTPAPLPGASSTTTTTTTSSNITNIKKRTGASRSRSPKTKSPNNHNNHNAIRTSDNINDTTNIKAAAKAAAAAASSKNNDNDIITTRKRTHRKKALPTAQPQSSHLYPDSESIQDPNHHDHTFPVVRDSTASSVYPPPATVPGAVAMDGISDRQRISNLTGSLVYGDPTTSSSSSSPTMSHRTSSLKTASSSGGTSAIDGSDSIDMEAHRHHQSLLTGIHHHSQNNQNTTTTSNQNQNHLPVVAEMVDDAEAIIYAKDVQEDDTDWRRRRFTLCLCFCFMIAVAIVLVVVLVHNDTAHPFPNNVNADVHPECLGFYDSDGHYDANRVGVPANGKLPVRQCFCNDVMEMELTDMQYQVYKRRTTMSRLVTAVIRDQEEYDEIVDIINALNDNDDNNNNNNNTDADEIATSNNILISTSCHPLHQAIVAETLFLTSDVFLDSTDEETGLQQGEGFIMALPQDVLDSLLFGIFFYIVTDGLNWQDQQNWLIAEDPCSWTGIGCTFLDAISTLSFPGNQLNGNLSWTSKSWWTLGAPNLRSVDLSRNPNLVGSLPRDLLVNASSIDTIQVERTGLTGPLPKKARASLNRRMDALRLRFNGFTGTLPPSWFVHQHDGDESVRGIRLRHLDLGNNGLTGTIPKEIRLAQDLVSLQLMSNALNGTLPVEMEQLTSLELLDVGNNTLSGTIPDFLGTLPWLNMMNFYKSGLTGAIPETFCTTNFTGQLAARSRRIFVECATTPFCSCCASGTGSSISERPVRILCAEDLPEFIMEEFDGF